MSDDQPRFGAYERPAAQTQVCLPSVPVQNRLDGDSAGSQTIPNQGPASAVPYSSSLSMSASHKCPLCDRVFETKGGYAKHRTAHARKKVVSIPQYVSGTGFNCKDCTSSFNGKIGLSQHRRQKHPSEYNAERVATLPDSPYMWSSLEEARLCAKASEISADYVKFEDLLKRLHEIFPSRTSMAIRARLRQLHWVRPARPVTNAQPAILPYSTREQETSDFSSSFAQRIIASLAAQPLSLAAENDPDSVMSKAEHVALIRANDPSNNVSSIRRQKPCTRASSRLLRSAPVSRTTSPTNEMTLRATVLFANKGVSACQTNSLGQPTSPDKNRSQYLRGSVTEVNTRTHHSWSAAARILSRRPCVPASSRQLRSAPVSQPSSPVKDITTRTTREMNTGDAANCQTSVPRRPTSPAKKRSQHLRGSGSATIAWPDSPKSAAARILRQKPYALASPTLPEGTQSQHSNGIGLSAFFRPVSLERADARTPSLDSDIHAATSQLLVVLPSSSSDRLSDKLCHNGVQLDLPVSRLTSIPEDLVTSPTPLQVQIQTATPKQASLDLPVDLDATDPNTSTIPTMGVPVATSHKFLLAASTDLAESSKIDDSSRDLAALVNLHLLPYSNADLLRIDLNDHCAQWYPHKWIYKKRRIFTEKDNFNKKQRRRLQYGHIQNLYRRSKKDAAATILEGQWRDAFLSNNERIPGFNNHWKEVFNKPAFPDDRPITQTIPLNEDLLEPITAKDVSTTLSSLRGSSPGLDKISPKQLSRRCPKTVAAFLNVLLASQSIPGHLNTARVTFVPKLSSASAPNDFRPISVTSVFVRLLHKILFNRWVNSFPTDRLQFGFLQRDGCFEATSILHTVIRNSHTYNKTLSFASLDISKAFDTISQDSILRAAESFGAPPFLCQYLANYYGSATSMVDGSYIHPQRGVRQGDPLSPLLFIMAMDEALSESPFSAWMSPIGPIQYLAFADDIILFAEDRQNLEERLNTLSLLLEKMGLSINETKSFCVNIAADRRKRQTMLDERPMVNPDLHIPSLKVQEDFTFLGIPFNWKGKLPCQSQKDLARMLQEIQSAPLKPQQRIDILRGYLLPRLDHVLILSMVHKNTLQAMDRMVRGSIKKWLRLPKDTSNAFFHACINDGGLGIPHLQTKIPLNRRDRLEKRLSSSHPTTNWALRDQSSLPIHRLACYPIFADGVPVSDKVSAKEVWKNLLHASLDGEPLKEATTTATSHHWIREPQRIYPSLYIRAIKLRAGVLSTKSRSGRGRDIDAKDLRCKGHCDRRETISHVLQTCAITHDARTKRHNNVANLLLKKIKSRHLQFMAEPNIPTVRSFIKPDVIAFKNNTAHVLEIAICDAHRMSASHKLKLDKYSSGENKRHIEDFVKTIRPDISEVRHTPIIINNRGFIFPPSHRALAALMLTKLDISDLCVKAIQGSLMIYDTYMRGVYNPQ